MPKGLGIIAHMLLIYATDFQYLYLRIYGPIHVASKHKIHNGLT